MRQRIVVGVVLVVLAVAALAAGGLVLWLLVSAAAIGMLLEWAGLFAATRSRTIFAVAMLGVALLLSLPMAWGPDRATVASLAGLALLVATFGGNGSLALGLGYVGLPALALLFLRDLPNGFAMALWALAIVWATDIAAYFTGRAIGGPRLAPVLSPNKTWAGLAGGVVAAAIVGAILAKVGGLNGGWTWAGAPLAVLAQAGDLFESALKRRASVKDSGALLGSHGGLLDRLDGAVPVLIVVGALVSNGNLR